MGWWSKSRSRISVWLFPRRVEQRIDEEIRFHVEALENDYRSHGADFGRVLVGMQVRRCRRRATPSPAGIR